MKVSIPLLQEAVGKICPITSKPKKKFWPIRESYGTFQHIHFPGITSFQHGLDVQQAIMDLNLQFKSTEFQVRKLQKTASETLTNSQLQTIDKILDLKPLPTILTFEFNNVYAGGLRSKEEVSSALRKQFEQSGCEFHQLDRGGQVTWHGQGQLVAYSIIDIKSFHNLTAKCFVTSVLLQSMTKLLETNFGLKSEITENPGVWTSPTDKIASVGIRVKRGITEYGVSLNVNPELKYMNNFIMCGLDNKRATSIAQQLPEATTPTIEQVAKMYVKEVADTLNIPNVEFIQANNL
ncbi:Octanoyltransferase mitochondrial [Spathaspora sp. JA1]|nr:Octanoyltransferase mitochondrial [Spathaspora sp. JA1]